MQAVFKENTQNIYTVREREISRNKEKQRIKASVMQKLMGFTMFLIGFATPFILDGDATISIVTIPLGLYLMLTREVIL